MSQELPQNGQTHSSWATATVETRAAMRPKIFMSSGLLLRFRWLFESCLLLNRPPSDFPYILFAHNSSHHLVFIWY